MTWGGHDYLMPNWILETVSSPDRVAPMVTVLSLFHPVCSDLVMV
jgi:hypothetical protein